MNIPCFQCGENVFAVHSCKKFCLTCIKKRDRECAKRCAKARAKKMKTLNPEAPTITEDGRIYQIEGRQILFRKIPLGIAQIEDVKTGAIIWGPERREKDPKNKTLREFIKLQRRATREALTVEKLLQKMAAQQKNDID